jgi:REase_DpnII-MboI
VTGQPEDTSGLAAAQAGSWLTAAARRIAAGNVPGNLDGLFAHHILAGTPVAGLIWNVNPLSPKWLDDNRDRLGQAPALATLGYGLACPAPACQADARSALADGLPRLMTRDLFTDRLTFIHNSIQVTGIVLAAHAMTTDLPAFGDWLLGVLHDTRLQPADRFQELIHLHLRAILSGQPTAARWRPDDDPAVLALIHWMITAGTASPPGSAGELSALQNHVFRSALRTDPAKLTIPQAAVIYRAVTDILDASIGQMVLSRSHLGAVLRRFEAAMRRWRWDDDSLASPVRWSIVSEREVQDILWLILRSVFDDVVDEETLPKLGHSTYRADFGLPRLGVLIEVKYARSHADFKKIEKEVMEDSVAYLRGTTRYKEIVVFIYDESCSVQEHDMTAAALRSLEGVTDVVIVSRPSQLLPR